MGQRFQRWFGCCVVMACLSSTGLMRGQSGVPQPVAPFPNPGRADGRSERDVASERMQEQVEKSRNSERQRRLQADTEKLFDLATELKQEVAKTDKNTLSIEVIKKADEIEKLAHSVKERMKGDK